jgi:RNA polymerase sigma-70 factor (ECF subfamily)
VFGKRGREDLVEASVSGDEAMLAPAAIADLPPPGGRYQFGASEDGPDGGGGASGPRGSGGGAGWFEALVAEHLPWLRARAALLCRGHVDPDDLRQEALMRAFRAREKLRDRDRVRPWLLAILTNTFLDAIRQQRRRPQQVPLEIEPMAAPEEPTEPLPWEEISTEELHAAIARLPDDVRDTYRMFTLEDKDYVEIAAALHIAKSTVGTRILRARRPRRVLLTDGGPAGEAAGRSSGGKARS